MAVIGNVDSGKSTLVGVLTRGMLDDGRGLARSKVCSLQLLCTAPSGCREPLVMVTVWDLLVVTRISGSTRVLAQVFKHGHESATGRTSSIGQHNLCVCPFPCGS